MDGRSSVDEEEEEEEPRNRDSRGKREESPPSSRPIKIANGRAPVIATDRLHHSEEGTANLNRSNEEVFRDRTRDQPRNLIGHVVWSPASPLHPPNGAVGTRVREIFQSRAAKNGPSSPV